LHGLEGLLIVALVAAGCGGGNSTTAGSTASSRTERKLDVEAARVAATSDSNASVALAPGYLGEAPAEKQLPDDVKESLKGTIEPWLFAWRAGLGIFRVDQLALTDTQPLSDDDTEPYDGNAEGEDLRLLHFALPAIGGENVLDPFLDWTLSSHGNQTVAHHAGSPGVALIDLKGHLRRRLFDPHEPEGRIDGAYWLDERRFVVFAAERFVPNPWSGGPVIYLVDLEADTAARYEGPAGDYDSFKSVSETLDRRFQTRFPGVHF
jgi:hypothetical protein